MDASVVFVGVVLMVYMIVSTWWMSGLSNRIEDMELRSNFINSVDEKIKEMKGDIRCV